MKNTPPQLRRILASTFLALLIVTSVSCGKRDSWIPFVEKKSACEKAYEALEVQFKELKASVTGGKTSADRAAFWQATAALFIVISGVALVGGAALGSRARRDSEQFRHDNPEVDSTDPDREEPDTQKEIIA